MMHTCHTSKNKHKRYRMRYFIEMSYDGAAYCGWQRQRDVATVQQTLETALTTLLRRDTETVGAGRTTRE